MNDMTLILRRMLRWPLAAYCLVAAIGCGQVTNFRSSSSRKDLSPRDLGESLDQTVGQDKDGETDDGKDEDKLDDQSVRDALVGVGLRNYEQINATMATLTAVPTTNAAVRQVYQTELATALPSDNDIKAFLGSQQVAVFKLAVEYCDALVKDTTARQTVFGDFNFQATPAQAFTAEGKAQVAKALVSRFWGTGLSSLPDEAETTAMVTKLIDDVLQGKNMASATVTPAVVTGACTAVLASAPVTFF